MAEYNALFDQHPWSYPTSQSTPFPPYPTDQLGLLDPNSHSTSAWSQQPLTTNPIDPNNWFTNNQSPQLQPLHSELHSHSPIQQQITNQSPLLSSLNQQQSVLLEGMTHQRQASRLSFDNGNPTTSPQQLDSPLSVSSNSNINYAPPPPPPGVHSFLSGFTSSNAYPPPVSQEDYLRLLKQTQPQTSNIFPPSAPSPSSASVRPDSSSSAHSSVNPYSSQPIASTSASSSNHPHQSFSLPPPAQFHHSSRTQHERTPSTNSSIRTSSQDRNSHQHHHLENQNQQPTSNSPARNPSSSYPTYPSPQQHSTIPYPLQQAPVPTQVVTVTETEYNPSEPYIPLAHPNHPHYHHFLAAQRHQQQQLNFAPPPSNSQTNQNTIPNSLGFCPPAPGPLLQFSAPANSSSALLSGLGNNSREIGAGSGGEELKLDSACLDSKGKAIENDQSGGAGGGSGGFVKPRRAGSSGGGGGGGEMNGSISSTTGGGGGRKRSYSANSPVPAAEATEERERNEGSEDPEEDDLVGGGGFGQSAQASTSTSSGAQLGGPGGPGGGKLILPNSIDPVTGYPRRQTEVPAVEDDPSVRPYGCNYCFLDRTKDASTRAYWSSRGKPLAENELRSWRTVKELREHSAREHRDRQDAIKDYEAELNENPELEKNGKGPEQPFRCALEPCGKTFKSLAGLRFHFQNASANGHFLVTMEKDTKTGEERPTKKFKSDVQPTGRELTCPVDRCPKRFKQSAGLAYHLSHTPNHPITEEDLSMFEATLQSKTRWWFRKLGLQFAKP
ncbi:hypothetical protein JCM5353_004614 [Sporobolomyces roseus]